MSEVPLHGACTLAVQSRVFRPGPFRCGQSNTAPLPEFLFTQASLSCVLVIFTLPCVRELCAGFFPVVLTKSNSPLTAVERIWHI